MRYRRASIPGATYFFTVNLADRKSNLLIDHIEQLRDSVRKVRSAHPFESIAWVVLPDHMHAIWTLPEGDLNFPMRWNQIKGRFSRQISKHEVVRQSRIKKGERGIWQRRYWEHWIRNDDDLARHVDYIHFNPVKHGYARRAVDWRYSSFHRYVACGLLPKDWGVAGDWVGNYGEVV